MCRHCLPEYVQSCYICGRGFREFESYFIVYRLMSDFDREPGLCGTEIPYAGGSRYARCQDCPRPDKHLVYDSGWIIGKPDWNALMGEGKRRYEQA